MRNTIAKHVLWCLDKQQHNFFYIYLILYGIPSVLLLLLHETLSETTTSSKWMLNMLVTRFCIQNSLDAISVWKNVEQDISTRHYKLLNSSYDFLAQKYEIPKNNYLMLSYSAWILLSISKHFLNTFLLILCHEPVLYSRGMQSNGHQLFFYWCPLNLALFIVPHRKPIIIVIIIIFFNIFTHFLRLWPIRNMLQKAGVFRYCFVAHLLGLKVV